MADQTSIAWVTASGEAEPDVVGFGTGDGGRDLSSVSNKADLLFDFGEVPEIADSVDVKTKNNAIDNDASKATTKEVVFFPNDQQNDDEPQEVGLFLLSQKSLAPAAAEKEEIQFNMFDDDDDLAACDDTNKEPGVEGSRAMSLSPIPNVGVEGAGATDATEKANNDDLVVEELNAVKDVTLNQRNSPPDRLDDAEATGAFLTDNGFMLVTGIEEEMRQEEGEAEAQAADADSSSKAKNVGSSVSLFSDSRVSSERSVVIDSHGEQNGSVSAPNEDASNLERNSALPEGNHQEAIGVEFAKGQKGDPEPNEMISVNLDAEIANENPDIDISATNHPSYEFLLEFYLKWKNFVPKEPQSVLKELFRGYCKTFLLCIYYLKIGQSLGDF